MDTIRLIPAGQPHAVLDANGRVLHSALPTHPGDILREEVEARELKKADFARQLGILPGHLSEVFNGRRPIGARLALKLEETLGMEAELWLRLQNGYELAVLRLGRKVA